MNTDVENFEREKVVYINDELILKFLKVFSRAEYALKMSKNFCHNSKAEAKWDAFANSINDDFLNKIESDLDLKEKKDYLWNNPPKKQKLDISGELIFDDVPIDESQKETQQLLLMIRTMRNNLFHGGKHTSKDAQVNDDDRNEKLISASIVIIKTCMKLNNNVQNHYSK